MERKTFILALLCVAALLLPACTKDKNYAPREMKVSDAEAVSIYGKKAILSARCDYPGKWKAVLEVSASHDMANPQSFEATVDDNTISAEATGLELSTAYFGRITVSNRFAEAHSEVLAFTTSDIELYVVTNEVTGIQTTSATGGGNVVDDGGTAVTERGICWGTSHNPTVSGSHASSGTGTGAFTASMTGLTANTKYYVRAYATNSQGTTVYGNEVSFTTLEKPDNEETFTAGGVTFKMIFVEGGTFWMGAQSTNPNGQNYDSEASDSESPVHQVTLSSYYMGETEVTQALWQAMMGSNPSHFSGSNLPVETVSWNDCQTFIDKLNQQCAGQLNGRQFALPTEAQWEYAARGGNQSHGYRYSGSNTVGDVAWYYDNSGYTTHAVGTKQANELGLYDMSGNVHEWCYDFYGYYGSSAQTDPTGPATGYGRVPRGGGCLGVARDCRVSNRDGITPDSTSDHLGLRLSLR